MFGTSIILGTRLLFKARENQNRIKRRHHHRGDKTIVPNKRDKKKVTVWKTHSSLDWKRWSGGGGEG